jgi:hypothetical protein
MRQLQSESRRPGMQGNRRCRNCGGPLALDGGELCVDCRPAITDAAREAGAARRRELKEIADAETQVDNLRILINKVERRIK